MDRFRVLLCLALCAIWHLTPASGHPGHPESDTNVLARLEDIEKQAIGQKTQLEVQSKLIAELQTRVVKQESVIAQHEAALSAQQTMINNQQKTILKQQKDISNHHSRMSKQQSRLSRLERILMVNMKGKGNRNENATIKHSDRVDDTRNGVQNSHSGPSVQATLPDLAIARSSNRRIVMDGEGPFAFHAVNIDGAISHIGVGQKIMFPKVMINLGAGYHNQQGLFIAPAAGLYVFSTSIMCSQYTAHPEVQVEIQKNGVALGRAYAHGDSGRHDQGSVTVIAQLVVGDEVWVEEFNVADASYYGEYFTSFMGYRLTPL